MDTKEIVKKAAELGIKVNQNWDDVHPAAKPVASGLAILLGLLLHKLVVAGGVIVFFGNRVVYNTGLLEKVLEEEEETDAKETDSSPA